MKVLIVCSGNSGRIAPFILEQVESLVKLGIVADYFTIEGKGWRGYLKNRKLLIHKIRAFQPDIIHAHYGLSGLLANTQRKVPVITTYHGSDINDPKIFPLSRLNMLLSKYNIFVSQKNIDKAGLKKNYALIPCGVDMELFKPTGKKEARQQLKLNQNEKLALFAGTFDNPIKNSGLAIEAVEQLPGVRLLELKGYNRKQVVSLINAVDVCLMTSFSEGSPQFIKEAMACNCPVVSVEVGDVKEMIADVPGCYLCSYDSNDLADKLQLVFSSGNRIQGREILVKKGFDINNVAKRIIGIYNSIL